MSLIAPGTTVQVRNDWPEARGPVHVRTPHYLRGHTGTVLRHLGRFPNPQDLAFARPAPAWELYHVAFDAGSIWPDATGDIIVEVYAPWLIPA